MVTVRFFGDTTSEFISIHSTISPGISATIYIKVERLLSLLKNKKDAINHILDLVQDEFEVVNKVVFINTDVNGGDSVHDGEFNSNGPTDLSSFFSNENGGNEKKMADDNENGGSDKNDDEGITITSTATAVDKKNPIKIFCANVHDCKTGCMLSENWKSLYELGFGYFLDSVKVKISPILHDDENTVYSL
ncbi:16287_t:CDS:2 [Cetraspora pellucida]|uniref:16287_t:CDS:1 n=1 Tax=Cetraspora pellucida TaxID=1433469 RepID=A0A9N8VXM6_9GLOM|nr:16287_t:CDS:2 [Cetraspora pellucida]